MKSKIKNIDGDMILIGGTQLPLKNILNVRAEHDQIIGMYDYLIIETETASHKFYYYDGKVRDADMAEIRKLIISNK